MLLTNTLSVGKPRLRMFSKYRLSIAHYKTKLTAYIRRQNMPHQCFIKGEDLKNIFKTLLKFKALLCNLSNMAEAFKVKQLRGIFHCPVLLNGRISGELGFHLECSIII